MYQCKRENCNEIFSQRSNCSRHQKNCQKGAIITKKNVDVECSKCKKKFAREFCLKRHIVTCKPKKLTVYCCSHELCTKTFATSWKLNRHLKSHKKNTLICEGCSACFIRGDKYSLHKEKCVDFLELDGLQMEVLEPYIENKSQVSEFEASSIDNDTSNTSMNNSPSSTSQFELLSISKMSEFESTSNHTSYASEYNNTLYASESTSINTNVIYGSVSSYTDIDSLQSCNSVESDTPQVYILDDMSLSSDENVETESTIDFESDVFHCTITYLKLLKHQSKRSSYKKQEFVKMCLLLFRNKRDDILFMSTLADTLGFRSIDELKDFINLDRIEIKQRGRPLSDVLHRQIMYNFWKKNAEISNDRRNARHIIKIKPSKCDNAVADLVDGGVNECITKGGKKLKAQKHIYMYTAREMYQRFKTVHPEVKCSSTLFYRCKPFYISPATTREMEGCLCSKCLNPHVCTIPFTDPLMIYHHP